MGEDTRNDSEFFWILKCASNGQSHRLTSAKFIPKLESIQIGGYNVRVSI